MMTGLLIWTLTLTTAAVGLWLKFEIIRMVWDGLTGTVEEFREERETRKVMAAADAALARSRALRVRARTGR